MASGSPTIVIAGVCFLLAALAFVQRWRYAAWLTSAGAAILLGALAAMGLRAGTWPLTSEYHVALAFSLATALAVIVAIVKTKHDTSIAHAAAMLISGLLVAYARFVVSGPHEAGRPLPPISDTAWFPLHVAAAALAYGALAVAGAAGFSWLLHNRAVDAPEIPGQVEIEWLLDRSIASGFPLLTLSMIFGMIWAQVAWGRYWDWDLKESWTLITWLLYALYWHVRRRPSWRGPRLAWLALFGLAAVLFTFVGVDWLARSVGISGIQPF